ncbi:MAG: hypothetical protein ABIY71_13250 [Flavobacteriales bacterium]
MAQSGMDSLLERPVVRCNDVALNAMFIFQGTVLRGALDSAAMVLDHWHRKCPETEPWQRSRILELLARPALVDTALSEDIISHLILYRYLDSIPKAELVRKAPQVADYLSFTKAWSTQLMQTFSPGMEEYGLGQFYGTNANLLFPAIQRGEYAGTRLSKKYFEALDAVLHLPEGHLAVSLGAWVPTGELGVLGAHPELGFQIGLKDRKMNYDFSLDMRFGSSAEPYLARRKGSDTLETTSQFFGAHAGINVGRDVFRRGASEVQLIAGVGYDGFDTFSSPPNSEVESGSAGSFDLSTGVGYRYYFTSWRYVGLEAIYHWVDYARSHSVDLQGRPFVVRLVYGSLGSAPKKQQIAYMQYKLRQ